MKPSERINQLAQEQAASRARVPVPRSFATGAYVTQQDIADAVPAVLDELAARIGELEQRLEPGSPYRFDEQREERAGTFAAQPSAPGGAETMMFALNQYLCVLKSHIQDATGDAFTVYNQVLGCLEAIVGGDYDPRPPLKVSRGLVAVETEAGTELWFTVEVSPTDGVWGEFPDDIELEPASAGHWGEVERWRFRP